MDSKLRESLTEWYLMFGERTVINDRNTPKTAAYCSNLIVGVYTDDASWPVGWKISKDGVKAIKNGT